MFSRGVRLGGEGWVNKYISCTLVKYFVQRSYFLYVSNKSGFTHLPICATLRCPPYTHTTVVFFIVCTDPHVYCEPVDAWCGLCTGHMNPWKLHASGHLDTCVFLCQQDHGYLQCVYSCVTSVIVMQISWLPLWCKFIEKSIKKTKRTKKKKRNKIIIFKNSEESEKMEKNRKKIVE